MNTKFTEKYQHSIKWDTVHTVVIPIAVNKIMRYRHNYNKLQFRNCRDNFFSHGIPLYEYQLLESKHSLRHSCDIITVFLLHVLFKSLLYTHIAHSYKRTHE